MSTLLEEEVTVISPAKGVREKLFMDIDVEGQVIVHCRLKAEDYDSAARIWPTTFLLDSTSDHRSKLVLCEGIVMYPLWTEIPLGTTLLFTLVFSRLPRNCIKFDLAEIIPQEGGFRIKDILRNKTDVYHVDFTDQ